MKRLNSMLQACDCARGRSSRALARSAVASLAGVAFGCAPPRAPLPPSPPPVSAEQLAPWSQLPPLAPQQKVDPHLDVRYLRLPNGLGVTVAVTSGGSTSLELRVPSARDRSLGAVTAMVEALRAGTRDGANEPFFNPKMALSPIGFWTDAVATTFVWRVPQRGTEKALSLLGQFVLQPIFDPNETQLALQQQLGEIRDDSYALNQLPQLARAAIPGLERPSHEHDARTVLRLKSETLQQVHHCSMQPAGAELVVVGPVSPESVQAWASAAFGGWAADPSATAAACQDYLTPPLPEHPEQAKLDKARLLVIHGASFDPWITFDVPGPPISSADYLPFEMLSHLLEEHATGAAHAMRHAGATYGLHMATYDRYSGLSLLEIRGQIEPEQVRTALRSLLEDIRGLGTRLDAEELEGVKRRWRTETVDSWARGDGLAGALQWQLRRGRNAVDLVKVLEEGDQIDVARCREVADRYLSRAQPSMAITGLTQNLIRGLALDAEVHQVAWTDKLRERGKVP